MKRLLLITLVMVVAGCDKKIKEAAAPLPWAKALAWRI